MDKRTRLSVLMVMMAVMSVSFLWSPGRDAAGQQTGCRLADPPLQPALPLEMNTEVLGRLFKTVVMEKEVFICTDAAGASSQIVDVETFIEIIERALPDEPGAKVVEKRVEIARCVKDFVQGTVTCGTDALKLRAVDVPLQGCQPDFEGRTTPSDPVEMNTARSGRIIKTIKVEKEVLTCGNLVKDLYLFTEIVQAPKDAAVGSTLRPVQKQFEGIFCLKDPATATILRCREFVPSAAD